MFNLPHLMLLAESKLLVRQINLPEIFSPGEFKMTRPSTFNNVHATIVRCVFDWNGFYVGTVKMCFSWHWWMEWLSKVGKTISSRWMTLLCFDIAICQFQYDRMIWCYHCSLIRMNVNKYATELSPRSYPIRIQSHKCYRMTWYILIGCQMIPKLYIDLDWKQTFFCYFPRTRALILPRNSNFEFHYGHDVNSAKHIVVVY